MRFLFVNGSLGEGSESIGYALKVNRYYWLNEELAFFNQLLKLTELVIG